MATHGAARDMTIADLNARRPFRRSGFGMSAVTGAHSSTGRMPEPYAGQYAEQADAGMIAYTVLSYNTPIWWVTTSGVVQCPPVQYSTTTSAHQGLARTYA